MSRIRSLTLVLMAMGLLSPICVGADDTPTLPREALEAARRIAIQHNGRTKPLDSFARETLQLITGSPHVGHADPVATILSMMADPDRWQERSLVQVPFIPLREALGMNRKAEHASYNELVATRKLMRMLPTIVQKQQQEEKLSISENETMDAFQRFVTLSGLLEQKLNLVPSPPGSPDQVWRSIQEPNDYVAPTQQAVAKQAWGLLISAVRAGHRDQMIAASYQAAAMLRSLNPSAYPPIWRLDLEVFYNHAAPFRVAQALYLLVALALWLSVSATGKRWAPLGMGAFWLACVVHGTGIAMRVILGGRPPVSNFFETTLWLPFVAVVLALIFERIYHARYIALAAAILSTIALVLADHLPLDPSISPVVAVLHSNLWLTVHVLTIVASYGALGLATVLAHLYAGFYLNPRTPAASLTSLDTFLYRVIQVGVVLLAGGIMLGAVWANASWGRYWGWDPKETWALITLLWFFAVLHGRSANWISGVGMAVATIGGFFLLLMTYYGVSFYLVGLHSYAGGHAKPIPSLLIGYLIAEVVFLAFVGFTALRRNRFA